MNRIATLLTVVLLVIGSVSAFPVAVAATADASAVSAVDGSTHAQVDENASDVAKNVTPGERLAGVVGVGQAEFEGEIELRAYGIQYAMAATDDAKADVVAERFQAIQERLDGLAAEKAALEEARENGDISEREYRTRVTELAARSESAAQLATASEARAKELPAELLEPRGINVTLIQTLKTDAENLTGPEVAAIATSIAGPNVGQAITSGPPEEIGVPGDDVPGPADRGDGDAETAIELAGQQVDAAEERLERAEQQVNESDSSENATEALERAREALDNARSALADARAAMESGDEDAAAEYATESVDHAEAAVAHAQDAIDEARQSGAGDDDPSGAGQDAGY